MVYLQTKIPIKSRDSQKIYFVWVKNFETFFSTNAFIDDFFELGNSKGWTLVIHHQDKPNMFKAILFNDLKKELSHFINYVFK